MRGSLFRYRRLQARALLDYYPLRGRRRRHLALIFRCLLSKGGKLEDRASQRLGPTLVRSFFFLGPGLIRAILSSGGVYLNFSCTRNWLAALKPGDFVSLSTVLVSESGNISDSPLAFLNLVEGRRLGAARKSLLGAFCPKPRSEVSAVAESL